MASEMPGGFQVGQVVKYRMWLVVVKDTTGPEVYTLMHKGEADSEVFHVGPIGGYLFHDEAFYYLIDYHGRVEAVLPTDILG